jgi:hypothetical protein
MELQYYYIKFEELSKKFKTCSVCYLGPELSFFVKLFEIYLVTQSLKHCCMAMEQ